MERGQGLLQLRDGGAVEIVVALHADRVHADAGGGKPVDERDGRIALGWKEEAVVVVDELGLGGEQSGGDGKRLLDVVIADDLPPACVAQRAVVVEGLVDDVPVSDSRTIPFRQVCWLLLSSAA